MIGLWRKMCNPSIINSVPVPELAPVPELELIDKRYLKDYNDISHN